MYAMCLNNVYQLKYIYIYQQKYTFNILITIYDTMTTYFKMANISI